MYPRMCVYHKISVYSAPKKKNSIWINPYSTYQKNKNKKINPYSSNNLFIYFGPRKAKGKYSR